MVVYRVCPLAVTYVSPRHLYLVAVGAAIVVGFAFDTLRTSRKGAICLLAVGGATVLIVVYATLQRVEVNTVHASGAVSSQAVRDVEREADGAPPGSFADLECAERVDLGHAVCC
jgi:hypothetical protein